MLKYKVGDKVKVLSGKDKGREGVIERLFPKKKMALVAGVNQFKKHVKKAATKDGKGGIYELSRPIFLSKLAVLDPQKGVPTRISFQVKGGKKLRVAKRSHSLLNLKS